MLLDVVVLVMALIAFLRGWNKGFLWAACSLLAVVISIVIALKLSGTFSEYLFAQHILNSKFTMLIAFVLLFMGSMMLFRLCIRFIEGLLDALLLGWINKLSGALLYTFLILFVCSIFFWFADRIHLIETATKSESKTYAFIVPLAPKSIQALSAYLPLCNNLIEKAEAHLQEITR